jgi:hypothetical protein
MTFTGAWFTPVVPDDDGYDSVRSFPEVYYFPTESEPPALISRDAIYGSEDNYSVEAVTPLSTHAKEMEVVDNRPKSHYWKKKKM